MSRKDFTLREAVDVIDSILLDEGNARIRAGSGQQDCIDRVLRKRDHMKTLMKSIADKGLTTAPILLMSSPIEPGKWVVKDGNRRITALKLLNDPSLCADADLRRYIIGVASNAKETIPRKVDCLSSESLEAISSEMLLRHSGELGGEGQVDWSAYLRTIYLLNNHISAEYKRAGQYLLWAEKHGVIVEDDFPITNVSRFFNAKNIKELGFNIVDDELVLNISEELAIGMAARVIDDFGPKKKSVNSVFTTDLADKYLSEVRADVGLSVSTPISPPPSPSSPSSPTPGPIAPSQGPSSAGTPAPGATTPTSPTAPVAAPIVTPTVRGGGRPPGKPAWDRKKLFWSGAPQPSVPAAETKMRGVLYEIAQIKDVRQSPLTTAFLIRALIELSEKHYRAQNGLTDKNKLADNIASACDSMLTKTHLTAGQVQLVKSYTVTKATEVGVFNVDTLQKYLHRETHLPVAQTINTFWDELHIFVRACWK